MNKLREAAEMAMEALEVATTPRPEDRQTVLKAQAALREALAQPERKPLTNGEIYTAYITATNQTLRSQDERLALAFARAIERAHGIGGEE